MIHLADVESRLTLFVEGIAGRYYHIKPTSEFSSRRLAIDPAQSALTADTLLLPESLEAQEPAFYRVLALQQLGSAEFGTALFTIAEARARIPSLAARIAPAFDPRCSDLETFYGHVAQPGLLQRLFAICEGARVNAHVRHHYPGIKAHQDAYHGFVRERSDDPGIGSAIALAECLYLHAIGAASDDFDEHPASQPLMRALHGAAKLGASVYDAAAASLVCYEVCETYVHAPMTTMQLPREEEPGDAMSWLQREARLQDWQKDLERLDGVILSIESIHADDAMVADAEDLADGDIRPADLDLRALKRDREASARRIDSERATIRDALGQARPDARSYRYDEWDYVNRQYLANWCRLFEERLPPDADQDLETLKRVVLQHGPAVQQQLENIKPLGFQRVFRVADGDELDFNAVVQARQDIRAGHTPDERVYSRRERTHRDVCAAFLVDLSASTDDLLEKPEPALTPEDEDVYPNLRDPYLPSANDHEPVDPAAQRRIIDVQRESMLVMSAALEQLGDSFGIYGFSGYGRDCVEFFVAKEPEQAFTRDTLAAIAGMKPKRSTRMGPAIRHTVAKLLRSGNALKVLIILSDGFPQDTDYGPQRGEHEYGVQDTAKALAEAHDKGVETFCVTVDRSGHDYLKRMCPDSRYMVIDDIEDLPRALTKVYETLTA